MKLLNLYWISLLKNKLDFLLNLAWVQLVRPNYTLTSSSNLSVFEMLATIFYYFPSPQNLSMFFLAWINLKTRLN